MTAAKRRVGRTAAAGLFRGEDGSSMVEIAVTAPVLFLLMFAFMELCLLFYSRATISEAAREGTRYAMFRGSSCTNSSGTSCTVTASQVNTYVTGLGWPNFGHGTVTANTTYPSGGSQAVGSTVQVSVTYVFRGVEPFVPHTSFTMTSTSVATIVQ